MLSTGGRDEPADVPAELGRPRTPARHPEAQAPVDGQTDLLPHHPGARQLYPYPQYTSRRGG